MSKIIIIITLLLGMGSAFAQTPQKYTERLDSIVTITDASQKEQKQAFCYNEKGLIMQVLYYKWRNDYWELSNKREYFQDATGKDTLILSYICKDGIWSISGRKRISYTEKGVPLKETQISYMEDKVLNSFKLDYSYDVFGKKTTDIGYLYRDGCWDKWLNISYEYDSKGNLLSISQEECMDKQRKSISKTCMQYDADNHLVTQSDSVLDGKRFREWKNQQFFYDDSIQIREKILLTTIDHDLPHQTMTEKFYDGKGNLILIQQWREDDNEWIFYRTSLYIYDWNIDKNSIKGVDHITDITGDSLQCQNKIQREYNMTELGTSKSERIFYYSPVKFSH